MPAHKHANLMFEYSKDACESETPWVFWQYRLGRNSPFEDCNQQPTWLTSYEYRRKPRTITVNGFEVPEPYKGEMKLGQKYFYPALDCSFSYSIQDRWDDHSVDEVRKDRGLVHLTEEAADAHAKAMLGINPST